MEWDRDSGWQQGSVVAQAHLQSNVTAVLSEFTLGVVVSHDCDIANTEEVEPDIEIILARPVAAADGNCTFAKNPRKLHLPFDVSGEERYLELIAHEKLKLSKRVLSDGQPAVGWTISHHGRQILQGWLAARYRRHALPDELVDRLGPFLGFLAKKLKSKAKEISGIWIKYDPKETLSPDEPYELWMYIIYGIEEASAAAAANELAEDIRRQFDMLIERNRGAGPVYLSECLAVSEDGFTLDDLRRTTELKMEYLSHRAYPEGDILPL